MAGISNVLKTLIAEGIGEGPEGMRRIGEVILNRAALAGQTPEQIVQASNQFTGYKHPGSATRRAMNDPASVAKAQAAWNLAMQPGDPTNGANFYHTPAVNPSWDNHMTNKGQYGNHIFYADRPIPPGAIENTVGTLTDTVPPPAFPPVTISPRLAALRDMTSPSGGDTGLRAALNHEASIRANAVTPAIRGSALPPLPTRPSSEINSTMAGLTQDSAMARALAARLAPPPSLGPRAPTTSLSVAGRSPIGMVQPGNLDLNSRRVLTDGVGGFRTENSISIGTDRGEVLIPTVVNGKQLSEQAAIEHFQRTGENLGTFQTPQAADRYAETLHQRQSDKYGSSLPSPVPRSQIERPPLSQAPPSLSPRDPLNVDPGGVANTMSSAAGSTNHALENTLQKYAARRVNGDNRDVGRSQIERSPPPVRQSLIERGPSRVAALPSLPRQRPQTAPPDLISVSMQRAAATNPTRLPSIAPPSIPGITPASQRIAADTRLIREAGAQVSRPATPLPPGPGITPASQRIAADTRLMREANAPPSILDRLPSTPMAGRLGAPPTVVYDPSFSTAEVTGTVGQTIRPTGPLAPLPHQTIARVPLPANPYRAVGTALDTTMPAMPRPRPYLGMGGVDTTDTISQTGEVAPTPMPPLQRPGIFGRPQLFGHDIPLPGIFGVIQAATMAMNNASGPFNNGGDNWLYQTMRGGNQSRPSTATARAGGFLYAPRVNGGGLVNVGRVPTALSAAQQYAMLTGGAGSINNADAANRVNGSSTRGSGGARSLID